MAILRLQHIALNFDDWKLAFDSDPLDRKGGGVRRYQIHRSVAEPNLVMIDLEFDAVGEAEGFLQKLRQLWDGPAKTVIQDPQAWIVEPVESADL